MPTNTMKNTRFSVRQTERLFVRFRRSKAAPRIAQRAFSAHLSRFPSSRGISRTKQRKCLKSLYFALK